MPDQALLDDLIDWLRIPSISTGGGDPADLERAAAWVVERVRGAGGEADVVPTRGNPLAVGELRAAADDAPTVLIYGHYDVQSVGDEAAWTTPPFAPDIRDGRIYARGAADDKGNFLPLLHVACAMAKAGELPVHVRVLVEGEEEAGSLGVTDWVRADERRADAAIVFDSGIVNEQTPAITVGLRGVVMLDVEVRTSQRDLHSGIYGGSALNAIHVLHGVLGAVLPGPDGRLRDELRAGIAPASDAERASWERLPSGDVVLSGVGAVPLHPGAGAEYYERNGADASLDVNAIERGRAAHGRAVGRPRDAVDAPGARPGPRAGARRAHRPAPGARRPPGAEVIVTGDHDAAPALFPPEDPAIALAAGAIERATGAAPAFVRSGGSIPIVAELAARGMPVVVSGFASEDDAFHAPNESYRLKGLDDGIAAARELYLALAGLR